MAATAAERKRASRARQKKMIEEASDKSKTAMRGSFSAFVGDRILELEENLDSLGVEIRGDLHSGDNQSFHSDGLGDVSMRTVERFVGLAGVFMDASRELHALINSYKLQEVDKRIIELERADLPDRESRRAAFDQIIELGKLRAALDSEERHNFRRIEVKEVRSI